MSGPAAALSAGQDGLRLAVRLQPNSRRAHIACPVRLDDGRWHLRVWVTEAPEKGRANAALLKRLAKDLKLPKTTLSVVSGAQDRRKVVAIAGDGDRLLPRLADWIKSLPDA